MLVSIIIVNYNTPKLVESCLESIRKFAHFSYEVLVVDNGSTQKVDVSRFSNTIYLPLEKNLGFGGGNNHGAVQAKGKYLWLLNSDTVLPDSSIETLFSCLEEHEEIGIASPLLYSDEQLTNLQIGFYSSFQVISRLVLRTPPTKPLLKEPLQVVDMVVGASLVIRRELFRRLNGFDQTFFMFFEDDDLCYRAKKLGALTGIITTARIVHLQGKSISTERKRKALYYKSQNYFWRKHYGLMASGIMRILRLPYRLFNLLG